MKWVAHRGGSGLRVENTLAAFEHAIELGFVGAELDVHLTRDGEVVVHHDDRLNSAYCRDVDGHWLLPDQRPAIAKMTLAELQHFDIGVPDPDSTYARRFDHIQPTPGERVPTLRKVIRLAKARSPDFRLVIEIKASVLNAARRLWRDLVDATLDIVRAENFVDRSTFCSFDWGSLIAARERQSDLATWFTASPLSWLGDGQPPALDIPPRASLLEAQRALYAAGDAPWFGGFDPRRFGGSYAKAIAAAGGNAWFMYYRNCTREAVEAATRSGLESAVWSVNLHDPDEAMRLAAIGTGYFVTDYPK